VENRLPNAWLFSGIKGIGKRRVAEALASAILCSEGGSRPFSLSHPDLFIVEPEKRRLLINQIRELSRKVQFHPMEAGAKLVIIDDAETLTESAANSLLKLLEEPPSATHFVLLTSAIHRILPTIRSRCRLISFSPLTEKQIMENLITEDGLSDGDAERIAQLSQGSLGVAKGLTPEFIDEVLGRFEALAKNASAADVCAAGEMWAGEVEQTEMILDLLLGWYRNRLKTTVMEDGDASSIRRTLMDLQSVVIARSVADTTANKQLMFEQLLFSLIR